MFDIQENLKKLPDKPGVYMHKDSLGQVIYVGKAISLRNRVRQYFQSYGKSTPKLKALTSQISEFEYITCASEMEALILECNLIKKYQPKYNVLLRDDKTYPYIKVTISEDYPRVIKTRELKNDGSKYFGPYSDVGAVNKIVELLNSIYSLKRCTLREFPKGHRPCLNYHIGECLGVCIGRADNDEYKKGIDSIIDFLSGRDKEVNSFLKDKMEKASGEMRFEDAAKYRDLIQAAEELSQAQRVTMVSGKDLDVILPVKDDKNSFIALFQVRGGKMIGRETYNIESKEGIVDDLESGRNQRNDIKPREAEKRDLAGEFIKQYYTRHADVPHEILVEELPEDASLLENFLAMDRHKVKIYVPKRGENKALLKMAEKDTEELVKTLDTRRETKDEKERVLKEELKKILMEAGRDPAGDKPAEKAKPLSQAKSSGNEKPYRIEAYDISNTNGVDSVGAMVVYEGTEKVKKDYRRFKIKTVSGPDDYASLEEVLERRFSRAKMGDPAFSVIPDMIFMDGGRGQVTSALKALNRTGYDIPVFGMAKDDSHRTRALVLTDGSEIDLRERPLLFKYAGNIQEEVHRFAIEYHRGLRGKGTIASVLDEIEGIGPVRRNALLSHFGSVENIKKAKLNELEEAPHMDKRSAEKVYNFFR